jgi:FAD synthase
MQIVDVNGEVRECSKVLADDKFPGFITVSFSSKVRKGYSHQEWYPTADFIKNNPTLAYLTKGKAKKTHEDVGVVSSSSIKTLTDKTKKWQKDLFLGYPVWISRGTGEGQKRTITENTSDTLVIDTTWNLKPDKTSQYVISFNINDENIRETSGNGLPGLENIGKMA